MSNESVFLPAAVRDRIQDLMKSRKVTQAELAAKIGCSESALSRFISGKTDKLGDESIIRIARAFEVSTDFLLGEVDEPDRKNYDISELGLSVEAARNLYTQKVNPKIVSYLLENPQFADTTYQIARYLDNELTAGFPRRISFIRWFRPCWAQCRRPRTRSKVCGRLSIRRI